MNNARYLFALATQAEQPTDEMLRWLRVIQPTTLLNQLARMHRIVPAVITTMHIWKQEDLLPEAPKQSLTAVKMRQIYFRKELEDLATSQCVSAGSALLVKRQAISCWYPSYLERQYMDVDVALEQEESIWNISTRLISRGYKHLRLILYNTLCKWQNPVG